MESGVAEKSNSFWVKNRVLKVREFQFYLLIRFGLIFALNMQSTSIYYWVFDLTHNKLKLGLVGLFEVIPAVIFSLFAGHIVDRHEKRNTLLYVVLGYCALGVILYSLGSRWLSHISLDWRLIGVYAGVFLGGILRSFMGPSQFALLGRLVSRDLYPSASQWSSMALQIGAVCGPLVAGFVLGLKGVEASLAIVMIIELLLVIPMLSIKRKEIIRKTSEPILKSLSAGLKFVFHTPAMLGAQSLDMFAVLFGGAVALLPVYQKEILHLSPMWFGILRAAPGIGAIIMLIVFAFFPIQKKPGYKLFAAVFAFGICIIIFGISKNAYLSFFVLMLSGMFDAVSVVIRQIILQLLTPDDMRGRVAAVNTIFTSSSNELGDFESGMMAQLMGTVPAVVFGGSMTVLVVIVTFFATKTLRHFSFEQKRDSE